GVGGVAAAFEHRHRRGAGQPVGAGHHPEGAVEVGPGGEHGAPVPWSAQRPRSRPMSSFMISLEPAQIFETRASRQARATRYSFMKPYPPCSCTQWSSTSFCTCELHHF